MTGGFGFWVKVSVVRIRVSGRPASYVLFSCMRAQEFHATSFDDASTASYSGQHTSANDKVVLSCSNR